MQSVADQLAMQQQLQAQAYQLGQMLLVPSVQSDPAQMHMVHKQLEQIKAMQAVIAQHLHQQHQQYQQQYQQQQQQQRPTHQRGPSLSHLAIHANQQHLHQQSHQQQPIDNLVSPVSPVSPDPHRSMPLSPFAVQPLSTLPSGAPSTSSAAAPTSAAAAPAPASAASARESLLALQHQHQHQHQQQVPPTASAVHAAPQLFVPQSHLAAAPVNTTMNGTANGTQPAPGQPSPGAAAGAQGPFSMGRPRRNTSSPPPPLQQQRFSLGGGSEVGSALTAGSGSGSGSAPSETSTIPPVPPIPASYTTSQPTFSPHSSLLSQSQLHSQAFSFSQSQLDSPSSSVVDSFEQLENILNHQQRMRLDDQSFNPRQQQHRVTRDSTPPATPPQSQQQQQQQQQQQMFYQQYQMANTGSQQMQSPQSARPTPSMVSITSSSDGSSHAASAGAQHPSQPAFLAIDPSAASGMTGMPISPYDSLARQSTITRRSVATAAFLGSPADSQAGPARSPAVPPKTPVQIQPPPAVTAALRFMDPRPIVGLPVTSLPRASPLPMRWSRITPSTPSASSRTTADGPLATRSHAAAVVNGRMYVVGGGGAKHCINSIAVYDPSTSLWTTLGLGGSGSRVPPARRAHSVAAYGEFLVVFGGGDGPHYFNDVWVLDTRSGFWLDVVVATKDGQGPCRRRAHSTWVHGDAMYVYAGGDGARALGDLWRLTGLSRLAARPGTLRADLDGGHRQVLLQWEAVETKGPQPAARGYHTSTLFGDTVVVYGGSDSRECFADVWSLDLATMAWTLHKSASVGPAQPASNGVGGGDGGASGDAVGVRRLAHAAVAVGPYMYVVGGHDGGKYSRDVRVLDVRVMQWLDDATVTRRWIQQPPSASRGVSAAGPIPTSLQLAIDSAVMAGSADKHRSALDVPALDRLVPLDVAGAGAAAAAPAADSAAVDAVDAATTTIGTTTPSLPPAAAAAAMPVAPPARRPRTSPSSRGYHSVVLLDSRLIVFGGFDGSRVFDDLWTLDLGFRAYLLNCAAGDVRVGSRITKQ